jgi:hypothetical protein
MSNLQAEVHNLEMQAVALSNAALKRYGYEYWRNVALPAIAEVHHQKVDCVCQWHGLPARKYESPAAQQAKGGE